MKRPNQIAYEFIKGRILDGTYRPAERLVEAQLAEEIGVSRNTVKKVLLQIEQERLLVIEDNKGARVHSLSIEEIQEYYEIRKALEVLVVQSAVDLITAEQIAQMEDILITMEQLKAEENYDAYSEHNKLFHEIIYESSDKTIAVEMIRGIKTQLTRFQFRTMIAPGRADSSIIEHRLLLDGFKRRDKDAVTEAIVSHISNVSGTIARFKALFS
ncbi:MAG: GntR family transcriptional regulator [Sphaerochaeta sp.]